MRNTYLIKCLTLLLLELFLFSCEKKTGNDLPKLRTFEVDNVTSKSARSGGEIIDDAGFLINEVGICWSTKEYPTIKDDKIEMIITDSIFTCFLNGIEASTKYYIRSYAICDDGLAYGNQVNFVSEDKLVDSRDGEAYDWVKIGEQIWMAENLRYLPRVEDNNTARYADFPSYGVYNYDGSSVDFAKEFLIEVGGDSINAFDNLGVLYNWNAAVQGDLFGSDENRVIQGVCPDGWHLPSDDEWLELDAFIRANDYLDAEGIALKSKDRWLEGENGTDCFGFSAQPCGIRLYSGDFRYLNTFSVFWTSTKVENRDVVRNCHLKNDKKTIIHGLTSIYNSSSVRCLKD